MTSLTMTQNVLAEEIKRTRMSSGMTAAALADEIPSDTRTVFRYEKTGNVKPDTMVRLCEVLREPGLLPKYCSSCPVGQARRKYNLKKREKPRTIRSHTEIS